MSRSSSGFESSHLPSPESPALPPTPSSCSKTSLQHKPACPSCMSPSLRTPKNSLTLLSPRKGQVPSGAIARSQSCTELRRKPEPELLRRSFSLTILHKEQKRRLINPKKWSLTPGVKTEESTQQTENPQTHCEVAFSASSASPCDAACSSSSTDTVKVFSPKQTGTTQSPHVQPPSTVPTERCNQPLITPSSSNPHPETACLNSYTNHMSTENKSTRSISANTEARRLKIQRKKKQTVNSENLDSLREERL